MSGALSIHVPYPPVLSDRSEKIADQSTQKDAC